MPLTTSKIFPPLPVVLHDRATYDALRLADYAKANDDDLETETVRSFNQAKPVGVIAIHGITGSGASTTLKTVFRAMTPVA